MQGSGIIGQRRFREIHDTQVFHQATQGNIAIVKAWTPNYQFGENTGRNVRALRKFRRTKSLYAFFAFF